MKNVFLSLIFSFAFLLSVNQAYAVSQLNGKVLDKNNNPMIGAQITIKDPATQKVVATAESDFSGMYTVFAPDGTYDVTIVSQTPNGQQTKTYTNQHITATSQQNFKLNATTNAPVSNAKDNKLYIYILGAILLLFVIAALVAQMKKKKK